MADPTPAKRNRIHSVPPVSLPDRDQSGVHRPVPLTSFVGREREVAAVVALLRRPGVRLVTLTGPGGVGKTRLAIRVVEAVAADFPEGVCFVSLAPVRDPGLVATALAQALAVREVGDTPLLERLIAFLRGRETLLVLDNLEQVLGAATLVADLLVACPSLTALVTSRAVLHVSGEHAFDVPPLALPASSDLPPSEMAGSPAVRLFVERAQAIKDDFALTAANAPAVAEICRRLDGLPLAIELAAARVRLLPPPALLARLERHLPVLTGGPRDQPARLQTMRAAIAWSYDLLTAEQQALFRRLSVFVGGFTLGTAEIIAGDGVSTMDVGNGRAPSPDVLDGIAALLDQSLLRQEAGVGDEPRYQMLETVREFGLERLEASGEAEDVRQAHYRAMAEVASAPDGGAHELAWLDRIEADLGNVRAALAWSLAGGEPEPLVRLASVLWGFWRGRGHFGEGRGWLEQAIRVGNALPAEMLVEAMVGASVLAFDQGDLARARALSTDLLARSRAEGVPDGVLWGFTCLGSIALWEGDTDAAMECFEQARAVAPATASPVCSAVIAADGLAQTALQRGDAAEAAAWSEQVVAGTRESGQASCIAASLVLAGNVARAQGDGQKAASLLRESLTLRRELRDVPGVRACLLGLAFVLGEAGLAEPTVRLLAAAEAVREAHGLGYDQIMRAEDVALAAAAAQACLGEAAFAAAWAAGSVLSMEEAIAEAMAIEPPARASAVAAPDPSILFGLTQREREVLCLLVAGRSDREIAAALSVARKTASDHVSHILRKVGVANRTEAAAVAVRDGLV